MKIKQNNFDKLKNNFARKNESQRRKFTLITNVWRFQFASDVDHLKYAVVIQRGYACELN